MTIEPKFAYHGTPDIQKVLSEGLRAKHADTSPCVGMALTPADAAAFGDVVRIDLSMLDGTWPTDIIGQPVWQAHYRHDIPADALRTWLNVSGSVGEEVADG